jgi:HPt (histidine-containing phosphotransfer) domain-containing protein
MIDLTDIPVLNLMTINSIISQANGNEKLIHEIFESFVYDVQNMINQIEIAIKNNDFKQFKLIIHTMKGLSATIGASQLHQIAKEMDLFLKNEQYVEASNCIPSLITIYDTCKKQVKEKFNIA